MKAVRGNPAGIFSSSLHTTTMFPPANGPMQRLHIGSVSVPHPWPYLHTRRRRRSLTKHATRLIQATHEISRIISHDDHFVRVIVQEGPKRRFKRLQSQLRHYRPGNPLRWHTNYQVVYARQERRRDAELRLQLGAAEEPPRRAEADCRAAWPALKAPGQPVARQVSGKQIEETPVILAWRR